MSDQPLVRVFGRYVVADTRVCHGALTFRGTRIFVADVLEQVAEGLDWDSIVEEWRGAVSKEAIAEAIKLAREAMLAHWQELPTAAGERTSSTRTSRKASGSSCGAGAFTSSRSATRSAVRL